MDAHLSAIKDFSVKPVDGILSVLGICVFDKRNAPGQACHVIHWDVHIPGQCRLVMRKQLHGTQQRPEQVCMESRLKFKLRIFLCTLSIPT